MGLPKIIDNQHRSLAEILREVAGDHEHLSIATGYWDLAGTLEIIEQIKGYKSIRLLIGQEPFSSKRLNIKNIYEAFPEQDIATDLEDLKANDNNELNQLRATAKILANLAQEKVLEVKVCRKPFLHAKTYIFGNFESDSPIGIIGSSNFTRKGLVNINDGGNAELNTPEQEPLIVKYPISDKSQYGHLSWFEEMWNRDDVEDWSGDFSKILEDSPVGNMSFGAYDIYIKTLMEVFSDELIPKPELGSKVEDILYSFQNRNAGILVNKLEKMGMAILSDSVGLGKTITAGAVVRHYIDRGAKRIIIVVPASLKQQWIADLANVFGLIESMDFKVVSQQDISAIDRIADLDRFKQVDLFIVDEAHNLRNAGSERHQKLLEWFQKNEESKILLLTATPINNSLNDLVNQIQLGLKGHLDSIPVPYRRPSKDGKTGKLEIIDFFEALNNIQKRSKNEQNFDWESVKPTIVSGISNYLVRSTRQGVEKEGGIITKDGERKAFPTSHVRQVDYSYKPEVAENVSQIIENNISVAFEGNDPRALDLGELVEKTQQAEHPLDFVSKIKRNEHMVDIIPNLFQLVLLLGFAPYRPEVYQHKIYKKTTKDIKNIGLKGQESQLVNLQLAIHNMLHVTWLKRLESSSASLLRSVQKYQERLELFQKYLDKGFILSLRDIAVVEQDYGEDIEKAFDDWDKFEPSEEEVEEEIKRKGVERREADPTRYNINALQKDIMRDKLIANVLVESLTEANRIGNDGKLQEFTHYVEEVLEKKSYGKKILVFSFFADTINYLRQALPEVVTSSNFLERAEFLSGQSKSVEDAVRRFSPVSKKYDMKTSDKEIDYLFATDILSEGQNLQDAGILINYDLHWNPVRMIQRNGRINRLGSKYDEVLIANMNPENNIELYLHLVNRLERKINTIKNTIGTDQSILGEEANPIEFIEDMRKLYGKDEKAAGKVLAELEEEDDLLSWTNDHVFALREYLASATDDEVKRLQKIPLGKWNYLPKKSKIDPTKIIGLSRVEGKLSITDSPISQTFFVEVDATGEYSTRIVEDITALKEIQTTPDDNDRYEDRINVDRTRVDKRSKVTAKRHAEASEVVFKLKPSHLKALENIKPMFPDEALRPIIENGLQDSRHKRSFEKLVREINGGLKEKGAIVVTTVSKFTNLIKDLKETQKQATTVTEVRNVLFYAKKGS